MSDEPNYFQLHGERLIANGYSIIPIMPGSKKPGVWSSSAGWRNMQSWERYLDNPANAYQVNLWKRWPGAGIGIMCGDIIGFDIDTLDEELSFRLRACIVGVLGETPAVRVGRAPKMMLNYRAVGGRMRKRRVGPLEVLGEGQQFVAAATHPDTGKPYIWPIEHLADIPLEDLPPCTAEQLEEVLRRVREILPPDQAGAPEQVAGPHDGVANPVLEGTPEAVALALEAIANPDLHWEEWNRVGMAVYAATGGQGFDAFDRWSSTSAKYDAAACRERWASYRRSPPRRIGAGTIYHLAMEQGWVAPFEVALNAEKKEIAENPVDISRLKMKVAAPPPPPPPPAPPAGKPANPKDLPPGSRETFPHAWFETRSLVGEITRWIVNTAQDPLPTFALTNALVALGTMYGRRYRTEFTDTRTNLYAVAIAKPGMGKDHSRQCIKSLFMASGLDKLLCGDSFSSGSAMLRALKDYPSRISHMDELGMMLEQVAMKTASPHQRGIVKMLLELFSSSSGIYNGQEYVDNKANERVDLVNPNFNVFGSTTPSSLAPALKPAMAENGMLSRILLVPPFEDYPEFRFVERTRTPPPALVDALKACWEVKRPGGNLAGEQHLSASAVSLISVGWDPDALDELKAIKLTERERGRHGRYIWVRSTELSTKVAMIEAIARDPVRPVITLEIIGMARDLVAWLLGYAESFFDDQVSDNETEATHKKVLQIVKRAGSITGSDLARATQWLKKREREEVMQTLLDAGQIAVRLQRVGQRGAPTKIYEAA